MHKFSEFGIEPNYRSFSGNKISLERILNTEIQVFEYKVEDSKKKAGTKFLTLQIETNGERHVVFTGYRSLIDMIDRVDKNKFPFVTTIIKESDSYKFT